MTTLAAYDQVRWPRPACMVGLVAAIALVIPYVRGMFIDAGARWLYVFLLAFTVAFALTPLMIQIGVAFGLVDHPSERKVHRAPVPRIGGIAVYLAFAGSVLVNSVLSSNMEAILIGGSLLLVIGVWDDACELPAWLKLVAQLAAAGLVIHAGIVLTLLPPTHLGTAINVFLTLLWIVGITNAFNFFDGMDGLATGLAMLMAFFMGLVASQTDQPGLGWLAVAVIGACLGFFPYNFRLRKGTALVFLGDGGSFFLGFTLACLAVKGNWADDNPIVSFSNPLLIFGVLIYDMIHITVERIVTGKVQSVREWIDYVGKDHLHHRLERLMGSKRASVELIFALTTSLGLAAIVLRKADTMDAILLLAQAALIVIMITIMEQHSRREGQDDGSDS